MTSPRSLLDALRQDLAYAWRGLQRSPAFTAGVALTMALGLGANAAVFTLIDRIFLRPPIGIADATAIRRFYYHVPDLSGLRVMNPSLVFEYASYGEFTTMRDAVGGGAEVVAYIQPRPADVQARTSSALAMVSYVDHDYFSSLGVRAGSGRLFTADDNRIDGGTGVTVAVVSDAFWKRAFGDNPRLGDERVKIGGRVFSIIGVTPPGFTGIDLDAVDAWLPLMAFQDPIVSNIPWYKRGFNGISVFARVRTAKAERSLAGLATVGYRRASMVAGRLDSTARVLTGPIATALGPSNRSAELQISSRLGGVAAILLLIASANVATLLLVRAARRRRETAVRRALGMTTARLCSQLLTESLLLSFLGAMAALLAAGWIGALLRNLLFPDVHWADDASGLRLTAFMVLSASLAGILAGLAPAWQSARLDITSGLVDASRARGPRRAWAISGLIVGQGALSLVLLVGAGLFVESLRNVRVIDLGFDPHHLVTVDPRIRGPNDPLHRVQPAIEAVAGELSALPGVESIAIASVAPLQGWGGIPIFVPGRDSQFRGDMGPIVTHVSSSYVKTTKLLLVAGRDFSPRDGVESPNAVIVDETMARTAWPAESPLGKCIRLLERTAPCRTVVGVVRDAHAQSVTEDQHLMQVYSLLGQAPFDTVSAGSGRTLLVRVRPGAEGAVVRAARRSAGRLLPGATGLRVWTMDDDVMAPMLRPWRLGATLFSILGALAMVVATIGVFSVVSYSVSQRTHEMGIRAALGARLADIVGLVMAGGARMAIAGVGTGILLALALGRLVAAMLYGVSPRDVGVLATAAVLNVLASLVAALAPALRAARVDPARALRAE